MHKVSFIQEQFIHMANKKYTINKTAFYSFSGSASGIGVTLFIYAILPVLSGTRQTDGFRKFVWFFVLIMIVILVFSTIYLVMDNAQLLIRIFKDKKSASNVYDSQTSLMSTTTDVNKDQENEQLNLSEETSQKDSTIENSVEHTTEKQNDDAYKKLEDKRDAFQMMYVTTGFRDKPIYDVITRLLTQKHGGEYFIRIAYTAYIKKWIAEIPRYKDAEAYFGANYIGGKSNYNTQLNKKASIPEEDIINMGKRLEGMLLEIEKEKGITESKI